MADGAFGEGSIPQQTLQRYSHPSRTEPAQKEPQADVVRSLGSANIAGEERVASLGSLRPEAKEVTSWHGQSGVPLRERQLALVRAVAIPTLLSDALIISRSQGYLELLSRNRLHQSADVSRSDTSQGAARRYRAPLAFGRDSWYADFAWPVLLFSHLKGDAWLHRRRMRASFGS